ncbi:MAG TPA: nucleotidyltransferase family protein [Burkholderiaceae bacterium]|nr:nucleotidyltransferase family protein [Burkholderiaceae bacterium]
MADASSTPPLPGPPEPMWPLLAALAEPALSASYDESHWDRVIPLARSARLLGVLAVRVLDSVDRAVLPGRVQRHLDAGLIEARFRRQKTLHLLHTITPILEGHAGPWVLLKGAAYIAQDLPFAHGRLPADVDLMVPRTSLDGIERALLTAGWEFEKNEAYDQHYYRAWSHELPPMVAAGQAMELDLHHAILPPVGRIRPDTARLFADAAPVAGSRFHVLCPHDQVLHAIVHLVHDSDFVGRLRDLLDVDALFRRVPLSDRVARAALVERARLHGMKKPLHLAAHLCGTWFGTPGCDALIAEDAGVASGLYGQSIVALANRVLGPTNGQDGAARSRRTAALLLEARSHWLRMPPSLLAYHAASKGMRSLAQLATKRERTAEG